MTLSTIFSPLHVIILTYSKFSTSICPNSFILF